MAHNPALSILIPVFNWDIGPLFSRITAEAEAGSLGGTVEILALDDFSTDERLRETNRGILESCQLPYLRVLKTDRNLGRSTARSLLAHGAEGDYLLFLDCDVLPDRGDFIGSYLRHAVRGDIDAVCGGVSYRTRVQFGKEYDFHHSFGLRKETLPADLRNRAPWRHLLTSNIMVRRSVYAAHPFDERFTGYGYEDVEWGIRISERCSVLHIDNTVSHLGLLTRVEFFDRMRGSVPNYLLLRTLHPDAFRSAKVGQGAEALRVLPATALKLMDSILRRVFIGSAMSGCLAFILFQIDFALLLALGLKREERGAGTSPQENQMG